MSMCGSLLRKYATLLFAMVAAVTLGFAIPRARSTSPPQPTEAEVIHRLSVTQQELSRKVDLTDEALRRLGERKAQRVDEPNAEKASLPAAQPWTNKPRLDELERQLDRLARYVKDVETSVGKIDIALSTPGVLEKVVERQKASTRP